MNEPTHAHTCPRCAHQHAPGARFCRGCGAPVGVAPPAGPAEAEIAATMVPPPAHAGDAPRTGVGGSVTSSPEFAALKQRSQSIWAVSEARVPLVATAATFFAALLPAVSFTSRDEDTMVGDTQSWSVWGVAPMWLLLGLGAVAVFIALWSLSGAAWAAWGAGAAALAVAIAHGVALVVGLAGVPVLLRASQMGSQWSVDVGAGLFLGAAASLVLAVGALRLSVRPDATVSSPGQP